MPKARQAQKKRPIPDNVWRIGRFFVPGSEGGCAVSLARVGISGPQGCGAVWGSVLVEGAAPVDGGSDRAAISGAGVGPAEAASVPAGEVPASGSAGACAGFRASDASPESASRCAGADALSSGGFLKFLFFSRGDGRSPSCRFRFLSLASRCSRKDSSFCRQFFPVHPEAPSQAPSFRVCGAA